MARPLAGKVTLVTGASRGIGAATARKPADHGADVELIYGSSKAEAGDVAASIQSMGRRAWAVQGDANEPELFPEIIDVVIKQFAKLDILVNNAAVFDNSGNSIEALALETFERTLNVNVKAMVILTKAAAKVMSADGRIVNVGSLVAERAICLGLSPMR